MKKFLFYVIAGILILFNTGCDTLFSDSGESKITKNAPLLALVSASSPITVKSHTYNVAGTLQSYNESVFPSAAVYLKSTQIDFNAALFPTLIEMLYMGGSISTKQSTSQGADGLWFTGDDTFGYYMEVKSVSSTVSRHITYSNFMGTVSKYYEYQFDSSGRIIRRTFYNAPGTDGTWFTSDDVKAGDAGMDNIATLVVTWSGNDNCTAIAYAIDGTTIIRQYTTKRDRVNNTITLTTLNAEGTVPVDAMVFDHTINREIVYSGTTTITGYSQWTLDPSAKYCAKSTLYSGPGGDTKWFIGDDDIVMYHFVYSYDAGGYRSGYIMYSDVNEINCTGYTTITY